jgi:hypothetical protein
MNREEYATASRTTPAEMREFIQMKAAGRLCSRQHCGRTMTSLISGLPSCDAHRQDLKLDAKIARQRAEFERRKRVR